MGLELKSSSIRPEQTSQKCATVHQQSRDLIEIDFNWFKVASLGIETQGIVQE